LVDGNKSTAANRKAFLENTYSSFGVDLGFEYICFQTTRIQVNPAMPMIQKLAYLSWILVPTVTKGIKEQAGNCRASGITDTLIENKNNTCSLL
jgi:hypothetical protein